jgi:hypothetical protein
MLPCELLGTMERDDLNQRYGESCIEYGGKWYHCGGFDSNAEGSTVIFLQDSGKKRSEPLFDWRLLNTERLPSRWYWGPDGSSAYFLSYLPTRQWRRGYAHENTRVYGRMGGIRFNVGLAETFSNQAKQTVTFPLDDAKAISVRLNSGGDIVLDTNFALVGTYLMFKENMIGRWSIPINRIVMSNDIWEDELKELGLYKYLATKEEVKDDPASLFTLNYTKPKRVLDDAWLEPRREEDDEEERPLEMEPIPPPPPARFTRPWVMQHVNMAAVFTKVGIEAQVREQDRQIRNLMARRDWDDNG